MTSETKLEAWMVESVSSAASDIRIARNLQGVDPAKPNPRADKLMVIAHAIEAELSRTGEMERNKCPQCGSTQTVTAIGCDGCGVSTVISTGILSSKGGE